MTETHGFREAWVDADGFRIRLWEAGDGPPLVWLHGAGHPRVHRGHVALSRRFRVVLFEMPGFGAAENTRTETIQDFATTMAHAAQHFGLDRFNLLGTSFGGRVALWLSVLHPGLVRALVLEAPAAIRPPGLRPPTGSPDEIARRIYAHPERMPPIVSAPPEQTARIQALVARLRGPDRDPDLEERMRGLTMPVLAAFGTRDGLIPPGMGRCYKQLMPDAHVVFVYDAGHAISSERPEAFDEVVGDFLERADGFVISRDRTVLFP